jgi:hypothetical protein
LSISSNNKQVDEEAGRGAVAILSLKFRGSYTANSLGGLKDGLMCCEPIIDRIDKSKSSMKVTYRPLDRLNPATTIRSALPIH